MMQAPGFGTRPDDLQIQMPAGGAPLAGKGKKQKPPKEKKVKPPKEAKVKPPKEAKVKQPKEPKEKGGKHGKKGAPMPLPMQQDIMQGAAAMPPPMRPPQQPYQGGPPPMQAPGYQPGPPPMPPPGFHQAPAPPPPGYQQGPVNQPPPMMQGAPQMAPPPGFQPAPGPQPTGGPPPSGFDDGVTQMEIRTAGVARFRYTGNQNHPKSIEVTATPTGVFSIGRFDASVGKQQSDFEFDGATKAISRRHAVIERSAGGYALIDLNSSAGTFINGQKVQPNVPNPLEPGSRVSFGTAGADYIWEG